MRGLGVFLFLLSLFFFYINLGVSKDEPYFWIDDMFVTGILASKVPDEIKIYNWKNSFLSDHRSVFSIKLTHSFDSDCANSHNSLKKVHW